MYQKSKNKREYSRSGHHTHSRGAAHGTGFNSHAYEKQSTKQHTKWDKEYKVTKAQPLLEFLLATIPHQSRNNIKHLLSQKKILVDGVSVSQFDYQLHMKQVVRISKSPIIQKSLRSSLHIIYEDEDFLAIDKPAGLLSSASDGEDRETAYRMVSDHYRQLDKNNHIYSVHRLDKETSGVLLFTKSLSMRSKMQEDWNHTVSLREYIAVVQGEVEPKVGVIHTWLKQNEAQLMYSTTDHAHGQEAITEYKVLKSNRQYSMLEIHLKTGRKNQIRAHFTEKGHPVLGDDKYGEHVPNPIHRMALHASQFQFEHPITHKKILLKAPIPSSFNNLF